jgi:predicted 2-oxoglutarate/Fe(II)-dependent dioxygenase YbiX
MFKLKTAENFLSPIECQLIVSTVQNIEPWELSDDRNWSNRTISDRTMYNAYNAEVGELMVRLKKRLQIFIKQHFHIDTIYCDLFQVVRWLDGMEQSPHADDMKNTPADSWFHHREFGAIIYLNDNYEGGHTFYPQHQFEIIPKSGSLAVHPGDSEHHLHGVTRVKTSSGSLRYTLASFWTQQQQYSDHWEIPEK